MYMQMRFPHPNGNSATTTTASTFTVEPPPQILVLGGGFAGLAAARTLLQHCPTSHVTLLEAKDRFGGRVHSVCLNNKHESKDEATTSNDDDDDDDINTTINNSHSASHTNPLEPAIWADLGGMFWHGNTSTVFELLSRDFPHVEAVASGGDSAIPVLDSATWLRYHHDSDDHRPQPVTKKEIQRSKELYDAWEAAMHQRYQQEAGAHFVATDSETAQLLSSWSDDFWSTLTDPLERDLLQLQMTMSFEMDRGIGWENHTLTSLDKDWDWVNILGDDVIARQGMHGYVTALVDDIRKMGGQLLLNQRVTAIEYGHPHHHPGCTVTTEAGREFHGDFVVVALPLGVLKQRALTLFSPPLPSPHMDALNRAGVGVLNTLIVRWNRALALPGQSNAYYFLQSKHKDNPLRHGFSCPSHLRQSQEKSPNTITQFHFSETNHPFHDLTYWKRQALQIVQDVVEEPLSLDDILVAHVSQWHLDPDIRGAYSAATTRTRGNADRRILATPVGRRLFFAGEHTHTQGRYQSMDGAYETGVRAAYEILQVLVPAWRKNVTSSSYNNVATGRA